MTRMTPIRVSIWRVVPGQSGAMHSGGYASGKNKNSILESAPSASSCFSV
jgi:hypothetical protein